MGISEVLNPRVQRKCLQISEKIFAKKTWHGGASMKKEEILKACRKENKNKDLAEMEVMQHVASGNSRRKSGALVCCGVSLLSSMLAHTLLYSPWII